MKIPFRQFNKGLWLSPSVDEMPQGTLRRARGIHPLSSMSLRSRDGSAELYTLANVHTIGYFADSWVAGASTVFYYAGAQLYTTFTETDVAADRVTVAASTIIVENLDTDEAVFVSKDFTAAYFDADYDFRLRTKCTLSVAGKCAVWGLANVDDNWEDLEGANEDCHLLYWEEGNADSDTSLLIHCDGADEGTSFTDNSSTGHTVTATGDAQTDIAQKKFSVSSCLLDGTGDYLSLADHADWDFNSGNTTLEAQLMFNSLTIAAADSYTKLLLHFNGIDEATACNDSSPSAHSVAANGGAQLDTAQSKFGISSAYFNTVDDYFSAPDSADWNMGSGNVTLETWFRSSAAFPNMVIFEQAQDGNNYVQLVIETYGAAQIRLKFDIYSSGVNIVSVAKTITGDYSVNTWYHIALIRGWASGANSWVVCFDGEPSSTVTDVSSWPGLNGDIKIGSRVVADTWLDEFRISKGVARWTADFSSSLPTCLRASMYSLMSQYKDASNYVHIYYDVDRSVLGCVARLSASTVIQLEASWAPDTMTWYHFALIRGWAGGADTWAFCVGGLDIGTVEDSSDWPNIAAALQIGDYADTDVTYVAYNGWMDEIRISKGKARWTAIFTPPSAPHSNIQLTLQETNSTVDTTDSTTAGLISHDTNYYLTIARDDDAGTYGSLVCTIYSDSQRANVVDTLTVTLTEQQNFRYLFAMNAYNGATGGTAWSGLIADLFIEAPTQDLGSVKTGLNGDRLSLSKMPPTAGKPDYLFVAGGGALFKVSSAGAMTLWGIVAPTAAPSAAETDDGAGNLADGTYKYKVTYLNSTTGHRSDAYATAASVTIASGPSNVNLTSVPVSSDGQVDDRELWRTVVGGSVYFYLAAIGDNSTTTYKDTVVDASLSSTELPDDNLIPYAWFDDCVGPYNASMFWITRDQSGQRGRVYYSPIGRPESVDGFIEVTSDDDALQKLVRWGRSIGVMSKTRLYQIIGTNPYEAVEVAGVPGTDKPFTVKETPHGLLYEADDGVRKLVGSVAELVSTDDVGRLFRGESPGGALTAFSGVVSTYARDEYILSDLSQTIALNLKSNTWRDIGIGCEALFYADGIDIIAASTGAKIIDLEKEGELDDDGTAIEFDVETAHVRLDAEQDGLVRWLHVDADTNGEAITIYLILDNAETNLGTVTSTSRAVTTFNVGKTGRVQGVRLYGNLTDSVEIFGIDAELYVPGKEQG